MNRSRADFDGKKVLVVESEYLMPFALYRAMEQLGAEVIGPVGFREDVLMLIGGDRLDGAIIDNSLDDDDRAIVQRALQRMHIPFVKACRCPACVSGEDGCFRLSETECDLATLGQVLFA